MSLLEKLLLGALAVDLVALVGLAAFQTGTPTHQSAQARLTPTPTPSGVSPSASPPPASPTAPTASPPARADAALAYDGRTRQLVMFGGIANGRYLGDTWTWDGHAWTKQLGPGPSPRSAASMTYDLTHDEVVLFGGTDGVQFFNDTWIFDGARWFEQHPSTQPPARKFAALASDHAHGDVVMYGGQAAVTYTSTWVWNGSNWTLRFPAHTPGPRHEAGMTYDAAHADDVLYGGSLPGVRLYDTWKWTGSDWVQGSYGPVIARGWSQLAFDDSTGLVIAFVTNALPQPPTNYFLERNAGSWTPLSLAGGPAARDGAAVAYDMATAQVVLFGGNVAGVASGDTWTWTPTGWSRAS